MTLPLKRLKDVTYKLPVDKIIDEINEPICINTMERPFVITIKRLELKDFEKPFNSAYEEKKEHFVILHITTQVYMGSEPFSKERSIKWKGISSDQNPLFNKKICFGVKYNKLPKFASILFKVKFLKHGKNNEVVKQDVIAWANFRLFDHNRRLKTGNIIIYQGCAQNKFVGQQIFRRCLFLLG